MEALLDYINYNFEFKLGVINQNKFIHLRHDNGFERFEKDTLNLEKAQNLRVNITNSNLNDKGLLDSSLINELREFDNIPKELDRHSFMVFN